MMSFDVSTAAKITGLSEHTLRRYVRAGWLKVTRCGRRVLIPAENLEKLVHEGAPSRSAASTEKSGGA